MILLLFSLSSSPKGTLQEELGEVFVACQTDDDFSLRVCLSVRQEIMVSERLVRADLQCALIVERMEEFSFISSKQRAIQAP